MPPTPRRPREHSNGAGARDLSRADANGLTRPPEVESIDLRTHDGWSLRADVHAPPGDAVGVAVLAHALMARRTEFSRPRPRGVAALLVERGWRVVAFDFRGHGDSRPPPLRERTSERGPGCQRYQGYDDFVAGDLAAVCAFAREQSSGTVPVVVVGHSLGGHAALVAHATGVAAVDGVAGIASAPPFLRDHEPSRARWLVKRATFASMLAVARRVGRFPARALRLGSDDATLESCEDFERFARTGRWTTRDGRVDYLEALASVRIPVLEVVSAADRFECVPACGERFVASCRGPREVMRVTRCDGGLPPPSHMGLVTSGHVGAVWEGIEKWMRRVPVSTTGVAPRSSPSGRSSLG